MIRKFIIEFFGKRRVAVMGDDTIATFEGAYVTMFTLAMIACFGYGVSAGLGYEVGNWIDLMSITPLVIGMLIMIFYWDKWGNRREEDYKDDWQGRLFYYNSFLAADPNNVLTPVQMADFETLKIQFEDKYDMEFHKPRIHKIDSYIGASLFVGGIIFFFLGLGLGRLFE